MLREQVPANSFILRELNNIYVMEKYTAYVMQTHQPFDLKLSKLMAVCTKPGEKQKKKKPNL